MKRVAMAFGVWMVAACASAGEEPVPASAVAAPAIEGVSMEVKSWGKLVRGWQVAANGEAAYRSTRPAPSGNFHEYDVVTQRFSVPPEDFARLRALLAPAEAHAGQEVPCTTMMTDGHYGHVGWRRGGEEARVSFNVGCRSEDADRVMTAAFGADELVEGWAKDAPVTGVEEVRQPSR